MSGISFTQGPGGRDPLPSGSVALGERLFKDRILSGDRTVSCASCHNPELAFADTVPFSQGVEGQLTARNTPSVMYLKSRTVFFWDGRARSLEQQAMGPITNPREMNLPLAVAVERLDHDPYYREAFTHVYGRIADSSSLLRAIADFERTLGGYDSPYDRYLKGNDTAMSEQAIRGFTLFFQKNSCGNGACHSGDTFGSDSLVNIGLVAAGDSGLYAITHNPDDIGKFKTPSLRNIAVTGPYMHNGTHKTLRDVVVYYNNMNNFPLSGHTHPDVKRQRERPMTDAEIDDLVAFLKALTDYKYMDKIPADGKS